MSHDQKTNSTQQYTGPSKFTQLKDSHITKCSSPLLAQDPSASTRGYDGFTTRSFMILPLALHFLGSLALAIVLLHYLDGRRFHLERPPQVRLADGTLQPQQLGRYSLLQPEVTTILSVWLMVLRWFAAMWSAPLCWRAIFALAGTYGVQYRDISWVTNYGILYPSTHFKHRLNLLLGLILILTLAPQPSAPLVTGSISWLPSNKTIDIPDRPTLTIAGYPQNSNFSPNGSFLISDAAAIPVAVVKHLDTAWTQAVEPSVFRRVIPSIAHLSVGSTVDSILLPYFSVTRIEWASMFDNASPGAFGGIMADGLSFYYLMKESRTAALLSTPAGLESEVAQTWSMIINVGIDTPPKGAAADYCSSNNTFLPANSTIPSFYLDIDSFFFRESLTGCFALANITIDAGHGFCGNCRVSSYSTVQNDTELQRAPYYRTIELSLTSMREYVPLMAPLRDFLPDPTSDVEVYVTALLTRLYSALWNSWVDVSPDEFRATTGYKPLISMLIAEVNRARVYAWLGLQLLFTLAGVVFIGLQLGSQYPLLGDTDMLAFDIDSTEVTKPSPSTKGQEQGLLRIEPKGDRWKAVAVM